MNLLKYIEQNYNKFTQREKLIANYLLKSKEGIIDMSSKKLGEVTKTSAPTVVRFAKKLGFNSLNEMKINLSLSLNEKNDFHKFQYLDKNLSTKNIICTIQNSMNSILDETAKILKEEELNKAINLLINAKNIYIFSVGNSALVALDFYYKLSRINKRCINHSDTHLQITTSSLMEKGDVALAISYSGETKEVLMCVKNARKNNIPIIAITKASIDNNLEKISQVVLNVPYEEKSLREGAITSRISQLAIIDMLFLGLTRNNIKDIEKKLIITKEAILKFKV